MTLQDHQGYLWFATDNGVVKYDGYSFKIFTTADGLPKNDVWRLYEDGLGRMFVFTITKHFGFIRNDNYKELIFRPNVNRLACSYFEGWNNNFFFSDGYYNVPYLDVVRSNDESFSIPFTTKLYAIATSLPKIYFYVMPNLIYRYDLEHPLRKAVLTGRTPYNIFYFISKHPLRWMAGDFAYTYDVDSADKIGKIRLETGSYQSVNFSRKEEKDERIYSLINIHKDITAITNKRIFNLSPDLQIMRIDTPGIITENSQVADRFKDNRNNTWYSTTTNGVVCLKSYPALLKKSRCSDSLKKCVYVGSSGDSLFYWQYKGSLYQLNANNELKSWYLPMNNKLQYVAGYKDSTLFLCYVSGIYCFNRFSDELYNLLTHNRNINFKSENYYEKTNITNLPVDSIGNKINTNVSDISYDGDNIFSTGRNFIFLIRVVGDTTNITSLGKKQFTHVVFDKRHKRYWVYGNENFSMFDLKTHILRDVGYPAAYLYKHINDVKLDDAGNIYMLHDNLLGFYNVQENTFSNIETRLNLTNARIEVYDSCLIVAGDFGISVADISGAGPSTFKTWLNTGKKYYNRINNISGKKYRQLLIQTDKGIFELNIDAFKTNALVANSDDTLFSIASALPRICGSTGIDTFSIPIGYNQATFNAINFYGYGKVTYSFKIDGIDDVWHENASGELFVNSLAAGKYYKVHMKMDDDFWLSGEKIFYIYKQPMWYQTNGWMVTFTILGLLGFVGVVLLTVLITRYFVSRNNEKKRALTELELKAVYSQLNPHFIFNTLNSALYFIDKKRFDDAYVHVNKFSKLLRAYLKSSQQRTTLLSDEIDMLRNYVELQMARFDDSFDYSIDVDNKLPTHSIMIPSLLLQPLVENAINHGLFHKPDKGLLLIKFYQGKDHTELICVIEDNGVGRVKAHEINKENSTRKESYGTKLTNQLMDIFREFEKLDISLSYTDKAYPESGTIVTVTIKNILYEA